MQILNKEEIKNLPKGWGQNFSEPSIRKKSIYKKIEKVTRHLGAKTISLQGTLAPNTTQRQPLGRVKYVLLTVGREIPISTTKKFEELCEKCLWDEVKVKGKFDESGKIFQLRRLTVCPPLLEDRTVDPDALLAEVRELDLAEMVGPQLNWQNQAG